MGCASSTEAGEQPQIKQENQMVAAPVVMVPPTVLVPPPQTIIN